MQNRARLLKQYQTHLKKQASYIVEGNAKSRRALRQHNREQIKQHPEWFPAPLKASDRRWQALVENNHFLSSDHLHNITRNLPCKNEDMKDINQLNEGENFKRPEE